ncbi:MAG: CapA family protein [Anaerovoracaceae bacterium]|jgi:poly-gamma-glutamate capsule biosynthesis protein CapA/YwtB (metallophosphatase superfamily)
MYKNKIIILTALVVVVGLLIILPPFLPGKNESGQVTAPTLDEPEKAVLLEICSVGDIMVHKPQIQAQYDSDSKTYNFDNNFEYIKEYIKQSDLALCNLETTFAGGKYTGYPIFNAPESLATALKKAGFDVAITANNHIMDKGLSGMKRTLEIVRGEGMHTVGTHLDGEKEYIILDVKGVKIGVIAYFYETSTIDGTIPTINGNVISKEAWPLLCTFNYYTLEDDLLKIEQSIKDARTDGAEIVICYFHWGEEYQRSPNEYQQYIAHNTAAYGADIIFASHPHVLQGIEIITHEERKVPVFYSMGNFISNQRAETLNNRYTEQGMIANVKLEFMKSTGQILSVETSVIPTWVDKYKKNGKDIYTIIPLYGDFSKNPSLVESGHYPRAEQALADIKALLGEEYIKAEK